MEAEYDISNTLLETPEQIPIKKSSKKKLIEKFNINNNSNFETFLICYLK